MWHPTEYYYLTVLERAICPTWCFKNAVFLGGTDRLVLPSRAMTTQHSWCTPDLATRSGKQLFFCANCGALRPTPDEEECRAINNFWAYEMLQLRHSNDAKPLEASVVVQRLLAALPRDP